MSDEKPYQNLIGLTEKEVIAILKKEDVDYRILVNGATCTCDYSASRVTLILKGDKIARVYLG